MYLTVLHRTYIRKLELSALRKYGDWSNCKRNSTVTNISFKRINSIKSWATFSITFTYFISMHLVPTRTILLRYTLHCHVISLFKNNKMSYLQLMLHFPTKGCHMWSCEDVCHALTFLINNMFAKFCSLLY